MAQLFFFYLAGIIVLTSILVVALRNPVYSALSLLIMFFHVAGLYVTLHAEFVAAVQIIVYAGAILVLYLFVLMLMNLKTEEQYFHRHAYWFLGPALLGSAYLVAILFGSPFGGAKGDAPMDVVLQTGDTTAIGLKMFSEYLLQFEIVGVFLLGAVIGAIVLAKTPSKQEADEH